MSTHDTLESRHYLLSSEYTLKIAGEAALVLRLCRTRQQDSDSNSNGRSDHKKGTHPKKDR